MLSGYSDPTAREYAKVAGADRFFSKASELDALLAYCSERAAEIYEDGRAATSDA